MADKKVKTEVQSRVVYPSRGPVEAEPGEDLYYDKANRQHVMRRNVSTAGAGRGFINPEPAVTQKMTAAEAEMVQEANDAKMREKIKSMGYAKGGMTASQRADGCAIRGKTRGKMV